MALETNIIYCGDNRDVLAKFPEKSVDLIYADPPFFSNKNYEIIWGNGAEQKVYEDRWKGGINVYIEWMKERLWQCYRVLKDDGSMYLHCDWHASHRLRLVMEEIFGESNFLREIIWSIGTSSGFKSQVNLWVRGHDTILMFKKGKEYTFNKHFLVLDERTLRRYDKVDEKGRKYKIYYEQGGKQRIVYADTSKGRPITDVWEDIIGFQTVNRGEEYLGYPTQKPEALLKRIIEASSNKNDIILDPFCGCGTTLSVAQQLGRKWIGIDVALKACNLVKDRLIKVGANNVRIIGAPKTIEELKNLEPFQFQNWVIERIGGIPSARKSSDMGIDGYTFMKREPVQVKQSEGIGRNVVDNFETAIRREHKTNGYIIAFGFAKGTYEEAARAKLEKDGLDIKLVRVDEIDKFFPHSE